MLEQDALPPSCIVIVSDRCRKHALVLSACHCKRFLAGLFVMFPEVEDVGTGTAEEPEEEVSASQMAGKSPNFCVLLHGSLKVEGMVALVQLG